MSHKLKELIFRFFVAPKMRKKVNEWYFTTKSWKKNDWRNWVAEEFERVKKTPWTLKKFPHLKDVTFEDLPSLGVAEKYEEAPPDYPAITQFYSSGSAERKLIKMSKGDLFKIVLQLGRLIWLMKNEPKLKNGLILTFFGLPTHRVSSLARYVFFRKSLIISRGTWRDNLKTIIKHAPFDGFFSVMPFTLDFWKHIDVDIFDDITFYATSGDILTDYLRELMINKGKEFGKMIYPVDIYSSAEEGILASEIPPTIVNELQYFPETHIALLRKENGEIINLFDAKPGDRGEILVTPLFDYTIPNYPLKDLIEVKSDESILGLPTYKIYGRSGQPVDLELEKLGRIKGIHAAFIRVKGININAYAYTNLLAKYFHTDHFTLIYDRPEKVVMVTYVENHVDKNDLLEKIKKSEDISYFYNDIINGWVDLEVIYDPEVVDEVKRKVYARSYQANIPRVVLVEREE